MKAPIFQAACTISQRPFGHIHQHLATLYTLSNGHGMSVSVCDFGAIITAINIPSALGTVQCVLGFDHAAAYIDTAYRAQYPYLGAVIGRHAGRIRQAQAPLNGQILPLAANHHGHHLHGGAVGFDSVPWRFSGSRIDANGAQIRFSHHSNNGDQGYPGHLHTTVVYRLSQDNEFSVRFEAQSDADTWVNLTQHSYFHLGLPGETVAAHQLQIHASHILATDADLLPNGQLASVHATALDFQTPKTLADTMLDHAYVLPESTRLADTVARLHHPQTGIALAVRTNNPVLVVYNGAHLPTLTPPGRKPVQALGGICFEAQGYTDAPNRPEFPPNLLRAGDVYRRETVYAFAWQA